MLRAWGMFSDGIGCLRGYFVGFSGDQPTIPGNLDVVLCISVWGSCLVFRQALDCSGIQIPSAPPGCSLEKG